MARRRRHEEPENHDRWLVSYADFITLLFAFFVVMYSVSSVNEGKYRVLSTTLTDAFVNTAQSMDPVQIGEEVRSLVPSAGEYAAPDIDQPPALEPPTPPATTDPVDETLPLEHIKEQLSSALVQFVDQDLVKVTQTERGIEVEMNSEMLFDSGSARLSRNAIKALRNVAQIIKPLTNEISVEGHTDNVPIRTLVFPSNWELSASRAASVVHYFGRLGVDSARMAATGFGQYRPLSSNDTLEGRQANRRVDLVILAQSHEKVDWELDKPVPGESQ